MSEHEQDVVSAPAEEARRVVEVEPERPEELTGADDGAPGGNEPCPDLPLARRVEALLIGSDRPLSEARLGALLGLPGKGVAKRVQEAIAQLNAAYETTGRSFGIERLAGGWQVLTRPELGELLARLHEERQQSRLSQAALETLAIVAYRQPIIRAEIEAVRGVSSGEVLRGLLERRLVKIVGRAEEIGRPMLYGTTREFLKVFGLSSLDDLPEVEGLGDRKTAPAAPSDATGPEGEPDRSGTEEPETGQESATAGPEDAEAGGEQ